MKIGLDDKTHRAFKTWCASGGITMQAAVTGLIGKVLGEGWGPARVAIDPVGKQVCGPTPSAGATVEGVAVCPKCQG